MKKKVVLSVFTLLLGSGSMISSVSAMDEEVQRVEFKDCRYVFSDRRYQSMKQQWDPLLSKYKRPAYITIDPSKIQSVVPVLQHTAAFIDKCGFPNTMLATQNIRECVNVTIHNPEDETSGMAHLDINTNVESLSLLLDEVRKNRSKDKMIISIISSIMSDRLFEIYTYLTTAGYPIKYMDTSSAALLNVETVYMLKGTTKPMFYFPYRYFADYQKGKGMFSRDFCHNRNLAMTAGKGMLLDIPSQSLWHQKLATFENTLYNAYGQSTREADFNIRIQNFRHHLQNNTCFLSGTGRYEIANLCVLSSPLTPIYSTLESTGVRYRDNNVFYNSKKFDFFPFVSWDLMYAFNFKQGE